MTTLSTLVDAAIGTPVFSRDGSKLGTVKAVQGVSFQVGVRWGHDYWLSREIAAPYEGGLRVLVDRADLTAYKQDRPSRFLPDLDAHEDGLLDEREQQEQRERLERELEDEQPHREFGQG